MAAAPLANLRFRMPEGVDIGPIKFSVSTTVQAVKEMVIAEWPKDFPRPAPADTAEVRLILNGKVLENGKTLMECRTPTGMLVTCHLLIRPKPEPSKPGAESKTDGTPSGCGCSVQ
mmetsp:Transcript_25017/g.40153  ORF Transcript_25017/g.40153 Transcript_25017/m.40153 type:complete len:116 (+) Transcript_25017:276-623(+)